VLSRAVLCSIAIEENEGLREEQKKAMEKKVGWRLVRAWRRRR
jgi:hypothetical protein